MLLLSLFRVAGEAPKSSKRFREHSFTAHVRQSTLWRLVRLSSSGLILLQNAPLNFQASCFINARNDDGFL